MPQKIAMIITNNNNLYYNLPNKSINSAINSASLAVNNIISNNTKNLSMGSMITRVHNAKPGCGSCGRH